MNFKIDESFLEPFESMVLVLETGQVPLLVMRGSDLAAFADQAVEALGGTLVYTSQPDFVKQMLGSMTAFDYLFAVIDEPLGPEPYALIRAYLAVRDRKGADPAVLAAHFSSGAPHAEHRLILLVEREILGRHGPQQRRELAELCTVTVAS